MVQRLIVIAAFTIAAVSTAAAQRIVTPKEFVMTPQAAFDWADKVASPLLTGMANDPKEIPGVRNRILKMHEMIRAGTLEYRAQPFYYPGNRSMLAHIDYDTEKKRPIFMLFVPAVLAHIKPMPPAQQRDALGLMFAHEMIHVEHYLSRQFGDMMSRPLAVQNVEEAVAYGKTVLEIVRPWARQGRIPDPALVKASEQLALLKGNYRDPRWLAAFAKHHR